MRQLNWFYAAAAAAALVTAPAAPTVLQKSRARTEPGTSFTQAALIDVPQRGGAHPPSGGHPPYGIPHGQPPSGIPHGLPPVGTTGHVRPGHDRPDYFGHLHAPDAPHHQRVYPVPGIPGHGGPSVFIPHHHYPQPFYHFYPRYWLGYGIYLGYPVAWPYWWGYPEYVYGGGEIVTLPTPSVATYGGISFDISPDTATVVVDGTEIGLARDFSPTEQPLALTPGRHHIVLFAPGLRPLAFDVDIEAGQVIPFSGVLQPR